jgi:secreted trypsin-like serine protease
MPRLSLFFPRVLCVTLLIGVFGLGDVAHAVTYGDPVLDANIRYPEVASLWTTDYDGELKHTCTATLVEQQIAITAAHCLQGDDSQRYLEVGATTLGEGRKIMVLSSWYNPRYSSSRIANDVAVVYLAEPANVPAVASLRRLRTITSKTKLEIAGWGVDQNGDTLTKLHRLTVKYDISRAKRWYGNSFNRKTTIAAGRYFKTEKVYGGACNGDSGGPLFSGWSRGVRSLVGIVSYGIRGCDENAPTVFASVNYYWSALQTGISYVKTEGSRIAAEIAATPPKASFTVTKPYSMLTYWTASVAASTYSTASITKWCFFVDGRPITKAEVSYGSGDMPFSAGLDGCFVPGLYESMKSGAVQFEFGALAAGPHQLTATVTDSLGRQVSAGPVVFVR